MIRLSYFLEEVSSVKKSSVKCSDDVISYRTRAGMLTLIAQCAILALHESCGISISPTVLPNPT